MRRRAVLKWLLCPVAACCIHSAHCGRKHVALPKLPPCLSCMLLQGTRFDVMTPASRLMPERFCVLRREEAWTEWTLLHKCRVASFHDCRDDGLEELQAEHQALIERRSQPPLPPPEQEYDSYLPPLEPSEQEPAELEDESSPLLEGGAAPLEQTLQLLVQCHRRDLDKLDAAPAGIKCMSLYRCAQCRPWQALMPMLTWTYNMPCQSECV